MSKPLKTQNKRTLKTKPIRFRLKKWAKELLSVLVVVGLISIAMDYYYSSSMPKSIAPIVSGKTILGDYVNVNELGDDGKPVIVYFWATWCGACKFVSPTINRFANDHHVVTVALSSGENNQVLTYMNEQGYQFTAINDFTGQLSKDWGIRVTPTIVIIKNGEIRSISTGVTSPMGLWFRTFFS